jgi:hypothetical protein
MTKVAGKSLAFGRRGTYNPALCLAGHLFIFRAAQLAMSFGVERDKLFVWNCDRVDGILILKIIDSQKAKEPY